MPASATPFKLITLLACAWALSAAHAGAATPMDTQIRSAHFTTTDGVKLHVLEACPQGMAMGATAPVIAFVPGWSMPAAIWREQLLALGATHCVAALDPRGQGESAIAGKGYNIRRRAEDVREFVARYPRVVLVGWSLAALESLEYINRFGHAALDALVLVDSSVGEDPEPPPPATPGPSFRDTLKQDRPAALEDFVRGIFRSERSETEIAALTAGALRMPLEASLSVFPRGVPRTYWRDIARALPKPLLYVVSTQFAEQAQNLQLNRPATQIEVFEEAGHALFVDEAARFNTLLTRFVTELGPAKP